MADQIPGVPEGWEVERMGKPKTDEWFLNGIGIPELWSYPKPCGGVFPIIRKIEKPAKYRPFKDAREADHLWNVALRIANPLPESKDSRLRINTIGRDGVTIGLDFYSYKAAFDGFYIDDDGTPFGVKIDE